MIWVLFRPYKSLLDVWSIAVLLTNLFSSILQFFMLWRSGHGVGHLRTLTLMSLSNFATTSCNETPKQQPHVSQLAWFP